MFDVQDLQQTAGATESSSSPRQSSSGQQVHLLDRLTAVFRHRRIAGAAFVIVVGLMMLQTYSKIPLYRASARVIIQDERTTAVGNLNANDPMYWQDSGAVLQHAVQHSPQPRPGQRVVQRLQLQNHPLFNGTAPQSRGPLSAVREARRALGTSVRNVISRGNQRPRREARRRRERGGELAHQPVPRRRPDRAREVDAAGRDRLRVVHPEFAALAATTLAEEYTQQNLDLRLATINKNLDWLTDEVAKQEKKVTEAEAAMTQYREQQNALSLEDRQNIIVARLNTLNDTATRARTTRLQKEASYNQLKSVDPKSDAADAFPVISTNLGVVEAKTRLNDLAAEKARLSARYLPGHPDIEGRRPDRERAGDLVAQRTRVIESARNDTKPR